MSIFTRTAINRFRYMYRTTSPLQWLISPRPISEPFFQFNGTTTTTDRFISPRPFSTPLQCHFSSYYSSSSNVDDFPTGDFNFKPLTGFNKFLVMLKTMLALPWERVQR
jgi:hypothetical protein